MSDINIFLSYCHADREEADRIYDYFKNSHSIEIHRDVFDVKRWGSFKEYMQSIPNMDYVILLISDAYLKSANCMYEVLEVMRSRDYRNKIFPAVISSDIYKPVCRARYVKHWENEFKTLEEELKGLNVQNLGNLNEDLKRCQDIASNIAQFLETVSDMNNPDIQDAAKNIEQKLIEGGILNDKVFESVVQGDLFAELGIQRPKVIMSPSDREINNFLKNSYEQIVYLFTEICKQYEQSDSTVNIDVEKIDARTVIYRFYRNGSLLRGLKIFIGNMLGTRETIGLADASMSWNATNNSWNGMYDAIFVEGELKLHAIMSPGYREKAMTVKEVVADIWENYISMYLERQ